MSNPLMSVMSVVAALAAAVVAVLGWRRVKLAELAAAGVDDARLASPWRAVLRPIAGGIMPTGADLEKLTAKLLQAGRAGRNELKFYAEEKLLGLVLGIGIGLLGMVLIGGKGGLLLLLVAFVVGLLAAEKVVDGKVASRRDAVGRALPGAIDLLMTCVDAGLSVEQAIRRVAREFTRSSPILADEFGICANECEAGVPLSEALRRLSRRVDLDDLAGLCSVIAQAHELGAPIVETLASYADSARRLRMARLEEWAARLAIKLLYPGVLLLLAALVIMLGPAFVQILPALKGT
jgi:tight adherence protein C